MNAHVKRASTLHEKILITLHSCSMVLYTDIQFARKSINKFLRADTQNQCKQSITLQNNQPISMYNGVSSDLPYKEVQHNGNKNNAQWPYMVSQNITCHGNVARVRHTVLTKLSLSIRFCT